MKRIRRLLSVFLASAVIICGSAPRAHAMSLVVVEIENYVEYLGKLVDPKTYLPEGFVYYNDISGMGSFAAFRSVVNIGEYYSYFIKDDNGEHVSFSVHHNYEDEDSQSECVTVPMPDGVTDLRYVEKDVIVNEDGALFRCEKDGIYYYYRKDDGYLWQISWSEGTTMYTLGTPYYTDEDLCDYPTDGFGTFTSKVLDVSTSADAVNDLMKSINKKSVPALVQLLLELMKPVAAVAVLAVLILLVVKKLIPSIRRRKKAAQANP